MSRPGLVEALRDPRRFTYLDGSLDMDLEASAFTNALPVNRLGLTIGDGTDAPAAHVRAHDATVERLEQRYVRIADYGPDQRFDFSATAFNFACELTDDNVGLHRGYPRIAVRPIDEPGAALDDAGTAFNSAHRKPNRFPGTSELLKPL